MKITNKTVFWLLVLAYPIYLIYPTCDMLLQHGHICARNCELYGIVIEISSFLLYLSFLSLIIFLFYYLLSLLYNGDIKFEINLFKKKDTISILDSLNKQLELAKKYDDKEEIDRIENSIKIRKFYE